MNNNELMSKLFGFCRNTYFNWKKEKRPIINLLEKYFTKEDLEEFLKTGIVIKQERLNELLEIEKKYNQILVITENSPIDNSSFYIEKLFSFYNVTSISQLAEKMNTSQARISNWKIRNSINAVKRKCRELGIYNEIF